VCIASHPSHAQISVPLRHAVGLTSAVVRVPQRLHVKDMRSERLGLGCPSGGGGGVYSPHALVLVGCSSCWFLARGGGSAGRLVVGVGEKTTSGGFFSSSSYRTMCPALAPGPAKNANGSVVSMSLSLL
jgi:hypothetical protein